MPQIPIPDGPSVMPSQGPGFRSDVNPPLSAFGGGQALEQTTQAAQVAVGASGQYLQWKAEESKRNADTANVLEGLTQLSQAKDSLLKDPTTGIYALHGKNAMGAAQPTLDNFKRSLSDISSRLTNDDQKVAFNQHAWRIEDGFRSDLSSHIFNETQKYYNDTDNAYLEQLRKDSIGSNDPVQVVINDGYQRDAIRRIGQRQGWSSDETALKEKLQISGTNLGILQRHIAEGNDLAAKSYYEANKDDFYGDDITHAERIIQRGSSLGEAQRVRDKVMSVSYTQNSSGGFDRHDIPTSLEDARQEVKDMTKDKPEAQREALQMVEHEWAIRKMAQKEQADGNYESLAKMLRESNDLTQVKRSPLYDALPESDKEHLDRQAFVQAKPDKQVDDPEVYTKLAFMSQEDMAKLSPADMLKFQNSLSPESYRKMADRVGAARRKDDAYEFKVKEQDHQEIFKAAHEAKILGLEQKDTPGKLTGGNTKAKEAKESALMNFDKAVIDQYSAAGKEGGKDPSREDKQRILKDAVVGQLVKEKSSAKLGGFLGLLQSLDFPNSHLWGNAIDSVNVTDQERARIVDTIRRARGDGAYVPSDQKIKALKLASDSGMSDLALKRFAASD